MLTPKTKAAGQAANDNQQLLHSNYTLPRIMSRFFLPQVGERLALLNYECAATAVDVP
jgi:hypothetical protein